MLRVLQFVLGGLAVASLTGSSAFAGDYYTSVPFLPTVKVGVDSTGATPVDMVYGKEYSNTNWMIPGTPADPRLSNFEDHNAFGVLDPAQNVSWDGIAGPSMGNSGSVDAFDYNTGPGLPTQLQNPQVDALANHADFLLKQVVRNEATLLFSITTDLFAAGAYPAAMGPGARVHWEDSTGGHAPWALMQTPPGPGAGVNHHAVKDLDGLEVWGPEPPSHTNELTPVVEGFIGPMNTADADRFSLDMDSLTGTSVWDYDIGTKIVSPYIFHSDIVAGVEALFVPGMIYTEETRNQIDVDGTMVRDVGVVGRWDTGDELLFTIDPIDDPFVMGATGGPVASPAIDGGEIMHLVNLGGAAFSISFLDHGGHLWNTAFDVKGTFGYMEEDVDGLEAVGAEEGPTDIPTPEPGSLALAAIGLAACAWRYRRG